MPTPPPTFSPTELFRTDVLAQLVDLAVSLDDWARLAIFALVTGLALLAFCIGVVTTVVATRPG